MKFGTFLLLQSPEMLTSKEVYARAVEQAEAAEDLGFESVWLAEHHFSSYGYCPFPLLLAVKIGERTQRVRIGTAVVVLPLHHPLQLAEEIAMADVLTDGRMDIGIGRGYQPYEFERVGLDISNNTGMYDESVDVIEKALRGESFTYEGQFYNFPETTIFPIPLQQPRPPFWVASQQLSSVEDSVRRGFNVITGGSGTSAAMVAEFRAHFDQAVQKYEMSHPPIFGVQRQVYVTETDEEASKEARQSLWHTRVARHLRAGTGRVEQGRAIAEPLAGEPSEQEILDTGVIFGSPETCLRKLREYRDIAGVEHFNCSFWVGSLSQEQVLSSMELFSKHVMPHLNDVTNGH